jgi:ketose-bisphosphate aldolase
VAQATDRNISEIMLAALRKRMLIPAFNVAYLPMLRPIVDTLIECGTFGIVEVARLEVEKLGSKSFAAVAQEYRDYGERRHTRLHLDHVPVIDEDGLMVDWRSMIREGLDLGYDSVMIDGSRLPFEENIKTTREVVQMAHTVGKPVEAELGAVLGHESKMSMPYQEIYDKRVGFTDPDEAARFVSETEADWLSVAIGNIHGAISGAAKDKDKVQARLDIEHLSILSKKTGIPLVLHGGSGVQAEYLVQAMRNGITKINIGTEIRRAYERAFKSGVQNAQREVSAKMRSLICDLYHIDGSVHEL